MKCHKNALQRCIAITKLSGAKYLRAPSGPGPWTLYPLYPPFSTVLGIHRSSDNTINFFMFKGGSASIVVTETVKTHFLCISPLITPLTFSIQWEICIYFSKRNRKYTFCRHRSFNNTISFYMFKGKIASILVEERSIHNLYTAFL